MELRRWLVDGEILDPERGFEPRALRVELANALHPAFLAAAVACGLVLVVSILWIREVPLRRGFEDVAVGDEASPQPGTRAAAR